MSSFSLAFRLQEFKPMSFDAPILGESPEVLIVSVALRDVDYAPRFSVVDFFRRDGLGENRSQKTQFDRIFCSVGGAGFGMLWASTFDNRACPGNRLLLSFVVPIVGQIGFFAFFGDSVGGVSLDLVVS